MKQAKRGVQFFILLGVIIAMASCKKSKNSKLELEPYLKVKCDYVHKINDFYIVGSKQTPKEAGGASGKEIFEHSVKLFSNFLDQNEDGVIDTDRVELSNGLARHMLFVSGHLRFVNQVSAAKPLTKKGLYAMSMQTNKWPYLKAYNGKGWSVSQLNSSTWRPKQFNALWEEAFHTVTEAYSRYDADLKFTEGALLRKYMDDDIAAGTYDISVQNKEENGKYDRVTAVNEYIHQIWAIQFNGEEANLNVHQKKALELMISKGVPMRINSNYSKTVGERIKG
jgi:hypothetical protein